jgi:chromosome segregation ATPase
MATTVERLGIVETKVANLDEKIDDIKADVNQLGSGINSRLDQMYDASCTQHAELANSIKSTHTELDAKISAMEKTKDKLLMYGLVFLAFVAGLGWTGNLNIQTIFKFFGI